MEGDEGMCLSKGSISVISYLHFFFRNYGLGEKHLDFYCDNCAGQNKNKFLLWYLCWRTLKGLHQTITLNFLLAGHTKFSPDHGFGLFKKKYSKTAISTLDDITDCIHQTSNQTKHNLPQLVGDEARNQVVPVYQWQGLLSHTQAVYSHFLGDLIGSEWKQHFAMFHSTSEERVKDHVLKSFSNPDGDVCILFRTIAFGMGINCQNLTRVFHFGPSQDIDGYVQESGRGGRDGEMCTAVLVKYRRCTRLPTSQRIKEYLKNETQCRREPLLAPFGRKPATRMLVHTCCDVCAKKCKCGGATCTDPKYGDSVITSPEAEHKIITTMRNKE